MPRYVYIVQTTKATFKRMSWDAVARILQAEGVELKYLPSVFRKVKTGLFVRNEIKVKRINTSKATEANKRLFIPIQLTIRSL